jgi:hypothetical protein
LIAWIFIYQNIGYSLCFVLRIHLMIDTIMVTPIMVTPSIAFAVFFSI